MHEFARGLLTVVAEEGVLGALSVEAYHSGFLLVDAFRILYCCFIKGLGISLLHYINYS